MNRCMLFFLLLLSVPVVASAEPPSPGPAQESQQLFSTITGRVMLNDKTPMRDGVVLTFGEAMGAPPNPYKYWRVPDLITPVGSDGRFSVELPAGTYFLMIAQKDSSREIGPATGEELLYFHGDSKGNARPVVVGQGTSVDMGRLTPVAWKPSMTERRKGITAVEGTVVDLEGNPVANVVVFAYMNEEATGRPLFVSDRSDKHGAYLLRVKDGGRYYLKVRGVRGGGVPQRGEYLNTTGEFKPHVVDLVKDRIVKGVTLEVKQYTGKGFEVQPGQDKTWKRLKGE